MAKNAFIDPVTGRLKSYGYVRAGVTGDLRIEIPDDFRLDVRDGWRWDGAAWQPFPFSVPTPSPLRLALDDALADPVVQPTKLRAVLAALREVTS